MEPIEQNEMQQPQEENLQLVPPSINYLKEAGKWAGFLAIIGFIFIGLLVAMGFFVSIITSFAGSGMFGAMPQTRFPMFLFGFIYLIFGVIYFIPILYLYRFSSRVKTAIAIKDQEKLNSAMQNLKAHYKYIGILMIIMLALYVIMFIAMIVGGMFSMFNFL